MVKADRRSEVLEHAAVFACILVCWASSLSALGRYGQLPRRRDPVRQGELSTMGIFLTNYGDADFSAVTGALEASPSDEQNPDIVSIILSLGNASLGRFERYRTPVDLARSLDAFESVASRRDLWGGRGRSGAVASYLAMSLERIRGECDVSGYQDRIDALGQTVVSGIAEEADEASRADGELAKRSTSAEDDAARVALEVWAANLLPDDPRSQLWEADARRIASSFSPDDCQSAETVLALSEAVLSYQLLARELPAELGGSKALRVGPIFSTCSTSIAAYETSNPVSAVTPGDSLTLALHDSQVVEFDLSQYYLPQFPPGSQCEDDGMDGGGQQLPI